MNRQRRMIVGMYLLNISEMRVGIESIDFQAKTPQLVVTTRYRLIGELGSRLSSVQFEVGDERQMVGGLAGDLRSRSKAMVARDSASKEQTV